MIENGSPTWEERRLAASPRGVRAVAADIPRHPPTAGPTPSAPTEPSPGPRDGGTSTEPPAGYDAVAIAARIGDSVETVLRVYAHEYEAARRREDESDQLAAVYDHGSRGSAMEASDGSRAQQTVAAAPGNLALARAIRDKAQ